jgi:NAD(P)H dehydrogenase (quinone)
MHALLVYAHPEPRSFNAALRDVAVETLEQQGYSVEVSDLYAMGFDPVAGRGDFTEPLNPEVLNLSLEQRHAASQGTLTPVIAQQIDALLRADLLVLQFPLWWFSMPAILKGWIDRVFISGTVYGRSAQFEQGKLRGKQALVCVTTGAPEASFQPGGINGDIHTLLMPLLRGVLGFTGMSVAPPFVGYGIPYIGDAARAEMLTAYAQYLKALPQQPALAMPRLADHPEADAGHNRRRAQ